MVRLFYNYFQHKTAARKAEIDQCFIKAVENAHIDEIVVLSETPCPVSSPKIRLIQQHRQPAFKTFFDEMSRATRPEDINIVYNSDCFINPADMRNLELILPDEAWCLFRTEIKSVAPLKRYLFRNLRSKRKRLGDQQDGWVLRGAPRPGMNIDFCMGIVGCDNRLAGELQQAGYRIRCPFSKIRLYHFHKSTERSYTLVDRLPGPYAYPEIF